MPVATTALAAERSADASGSPPTQRRFEPHLPIALVAWAAVVAVAHLWGERVVEHDRLVRIFAAPLAGRIDVRWGWRILPAVALGAAIVLLARRWGRTLPWPQLLVVTFVVAAAWAVALAVTDGVGALTAPLGTRWDYLVDLPRAAHVGSFLRGFTTHLQNLGTHSRAHPPGMLLVLRGLEAVGFHGTGPEAVVIVAGGASAVPATLIGLRAVAGEARARAAWPFVAIGPAALWVATSADALFAGVAAWGVAFVLVATARARRSDHLAVAGGLCLAATMMLSYGLVLAWLIPLPFVLHVRRVRPLAVALATAAIPLLAALGAAGYWWPAGLAAGRIQYLHSAARVRPQAYFWFGNLGALALSLGPAWGVAMARLRDRSVWLLVAGTLVAVALADVSGMSKGEVERIWLPFVPWLAVAGAAFDPESRGWLASQAAAALALQLVVRSPW